MKIGIISKHRVVNYGSFLQAFALKQILEKKGHKVHFIDYRDEHNTFAAAVPYKEKFYWLRSLYRKFIYPLSQRFYQEREHLFKSKLLKYLGLSPQYNDDYDCEAVIVGSDEIFNICEPSPYGKSTSMLGGLVKNTQILISYAASCGSTTLDALRQEDLCEVFSKLISRYNAISVRDCNTMNIIKTLTGIECTRHLDPVLVFDYNGWIPQKRKFKNYIIVYGYDYRISDPAIINAVKTFAQENSLQTIALGMEQSWCDTTYLPTPFELLGISEMLIM